jgi:hypothetical protein
VVKRAALILAFTLQLTVAHAEHWLAVERVSPNDRLYVDKDSQKRSGDIGSITLKDTFGGTFSLVFDCKNRLNLTGQAVSAVTVGHQDEELMERACRRSWEVWK